MVGGIGDRSDRHILFLVHVLTRGGLLSWAHLQALDIFNEGGDDLCTGDFDNRGVNLCPSQERDSFKSPDSGDQVVLIVFNFPNNDRLE